MAGKLTFTLEQYQEAATKYRADLLMLPIIGIQETLKFMTARPASDTKRMSVLFRVTLSLVLTNLRALLTSI